MREIVNALRYQNRTGCQWELLPTGAVRYYSSYSDNAYNRMKEAMKAPGFDIREVYKEYRSRPPGT
jgi:transposase